MELKVLIKDSCMSVRELSQKAKISRQAIYDILSDKHKPSLLTIKKICKALGKNYKNYID